MIAAHAGLSPSPLFGTANGGGDLPAAGGTDQAPEGDQLFDIISRTLGTDEQPAGNGQAVAVDQTGSVPLDDGLVPPADVGEQRQPATRRTTLLDVLLGG